MNEPNQGILDNCLTAIQQAYDTLTEVREEKSTAYDNLPESIQEGDRGGEMMAAIDMLDAVTDSLEDVITIWKISVTISNGNERIQEKTDQGERTYFDRGAGTDA